MSQNPDTPAYLPALVPATRHPDGFGPNARAVRSRLLPSVLTLTTVQQNRRLVAAQLPGLFDQRDQRRGIDREGSHLGSSLLGDLVEISLRFRQLGDKIPAQLGQIPGLRIAKYLGCGRIADRQRGGQRQDTVAQILLAAASERGQALHIADIVATVIEQPEQAAERSQLARAIAQAGAHLEHRSGIFSGDLAPVLDAERLP